MDCSASESLYAGVEGAFAGNSNFLYYFNFMYCDWEILDNSILANSLKSAKSLLEKICLLNQQILQRISFRDDSSLKICSTINIHIHRFDTYVQKL